MLRQGALIVAVIAALAIPSPAAARAENVVFPFEGVFDVCGDQVELSGNVLGTFVVTENRAGGVTVVEKFNPQGVTGTSLSTGATYHGGGATTQTLVVAPGVTSFTFVNRFFLIGEAGAPNSLFSQTVHVTVLDNGTITASVDKASAACVG